MVTRRQRCFIFGSLLLVFFGLPSVNAATFDSANVLYISHSKFQTIATAALAWAKRHPQSPDSPRLLFRVLMAATVRGDEPRDLSIAQRRLILDFPGSNEARYLLSNIPSSKAYRAVVTSLLRWFTYHPKKRNARIIDGVIRSGLQRFGIDAVYKNTFQNALLCYLVTHEAGDTEVANEMLGATEPSSSDGKYPNKLAGDEIREVVVDGVMTPFAKFRLLGRLGRTEPTYLLERYYLHCMPTAVRSSKKLLKLHAEELVLNGHFRRALALLAGSSRQTSNAHVEFLRIYCYAVLGRPNRAAKAAKQLAADFPKSPWEPDALELAKLAASQSAAERQVVSQVLQILHAVGNNVRGYELRATLNGEHKTSWQFYAGVAGRAGNIQIRKNGDVVAAIAWNSRALRLFNPSAKRTFRMPVGLAGRASAGDISPSAYLAGVLSDLGTSELDAKGILTRYLPASLKTYAGAMQFFYQARRFGVFFTQQRDQGERASFGVVIAGISNPKWTEVSATLNRTHHLLKLTCGDHAELSLVGSSSPHFTLSPPKWPPGGVLQQKKSMATALKDVSALLPGWFGIFGNLMTTVNSLEPGSDHDYIAALKAKALIKYPAERPPAFNGTGPALPPHFSASAQQEASKMLAWSGKNPNSSLAPEKLFTGFMLARLANNPVLAGRLERRLVLFYGSSLQGRYDLTRFTTASEFGHLVQALLKHNANKMTKSREVAILHVIYYGLQEFGNTNDRVDIFGTGHRVSAVFCEAIAMQAGWASLAKEFRGAVVSLATSDKTLASAWHIFVQPGLTPAERIEKLTRIKKSKISPYMTLYLIHMSHHRHVNPKIMRDAEQLYAATGQWKRACIYGNDLARLHRDSARTEFILAYCELRLRQATAARQTALGTVKEFPKSPWVTNLNLLASESLSYRKHFQQCVTALHAVDGWLIRKPTCFEITVHFSAVGKPAFFGYLAASTHFIQLFGSLHGKPFMALRIRQKHVEVLSPGGSRLRRYRSGETNVGAFVSIHRYTENGWVSEFGVPFSSNPYTYRPLVQQLKCSFLRTAAGVRQFLTSTEIAALLPRPQRVGSLTTFEMLQFSFSRPTDHRVTFQIERSGRPILLESHGMTVHFHFLAGKKQHFPGLIWPQYKVISGRATGMALVGRVLSEMTSGAATIYKHFETDASHHAGGNGAKAVKSTPRKSAAIGRGISRR